MDTLSLTDVVSTIVIMRPDVLSLLDRRGIDYCCHGSDSISTACQRAGISPTQLLAEIQAAIPSADDKPLPTPTTMAEWCDHIERTHHAAARSLLEQISTLSPRVVEAHGSRCPEFGGTPPPYPGWPEVPAE